MSIDSKSTNIFHEYNYRIICAVFSVNIDIDIEFILFVHIERKTDAINDVKLVT